VICFEVHVNPSDAFEMGKSFCVTRRVHPPLSMCLWANEKEYLKVDLSLWSADRGQTESGLSSSSGLFSGLTRVDTCDMGLACLCYTHTEKHGDGRDGGADLNQLAPGHALNYVFHPDKLP
jgi:hypothetical protein